MPMTDAEIQAKFKSFEESISLAKKDFEVKLEAANTDAKQWKETAQKNAEALKEFEAKAKKSEEDRQKLVAENRKNEIKAFVDLMKKEGRIIPAQEEAVAKLMESMTSESTVHTFAAKDGSSVNHTQYSLMKQFISSLQPHKAFVSMTPAAGSVARVVPSGQEEQQHFTEIKRGGAVITAQVDEFDMDVQAKSYISSQAALGKHVSYEDALIEISRQQKAAA